MGLKEKTEVQFAVNRYHHDQQYVSSSIFLSVIIPAYNEENRIGKTLDATIRYLAGSDHRFELIVVDDGSMDETVSVVKSKLAGLDDARLISYAPNRGKGNAIRRGVMASKGQYAMFMDADLSTPVEEVERAFPYLMDGYDIVIGSRALPDSQILEHQPIYREKAGRIFKHLYQIMVGMNGFQDTQCGFKVFSGDLARRIFGLQRVDGFMFDIETLFIARKLGCNIKEMPVKWANSPESRLRIVRDTARMFKDLLLIRFNHRDLTEDGNLPL